MWVETHPKGVGNSAVHFFYPPAHRVHLEHTRRVWEGAIGKDGEVCDRIQTSEFSR